MKPIILCSKCNKPICDSYMYTNTVGSGYTGRAGRMAEYYHISHGNGRIVSTNKIVQKLMDMSTSDYNIENRFRDTSRSITHKSSGGRHNKRK